MSGTGAEKSPVAVRSFLTVGPTLHYSHSNVQGFWFLALVVFGGICLLWSKLTSGYLSVTLRSVLTKEAWDLGRLSTSGISIFEYPWQIVVLGLLMGAMTAGPILIAQLLSFSYSIPYIFAVLLLAGLPGLAVTLLISCFAAACRPLRFRSRIIAIALCVAPQLLYWGLFGSVKGAEPVVWGISFLPWVAAWLAALVIAGIVLGIGHLTRYKPGIILWVEIGLLAGTSALFEAKIGIDELAYQVFVAMNAPDRVPQFRDHSLTALLDKTINDPVVRQYFSGFFYPTDPIQLRQTLKHEMQLELSYDRWPTWLNIPEELDYLQKRQWLLDQYDRFIRPERPWWLPQAIHQRIVSRRMESPRTAVALYYMALVNDYTPDIPLIGRQEILRFSSDYPRQQSRDTWYQLYRNFSTSPESIEARLRIARHWAGQGHFELAENLLKEAKALLSERLAALAAMPLAYQQRAFFRRPALSVMTETKLRDLQGRLERVSTLIGPENKRDQPQAEAMLAQLVMLNPYSLDYETKLQQLLTDLQPNDPIRDNVLLALAKATGDAETAAQRLQALHEQFPNSDAGKEALFELARLEVRMFQSQSDPQIKKTHLQKAKQILTTVMERYPETFLAEQAKQVMSTLPPG